MLSVWSFLVAETSHHPASSSFSLSPERGHSRRHPDIGLPLAEVAPRVRRNQLDHVRVGRSRGRHCLLLPLLPLLLFQALLGLS